MECSNVQGLMYEYVYGSLDAETADKIKEHILRCDDCAREYELTKSIIDMLQALKEKDPPRDFGERLHESLIREKHLKRVRKSKRYIEAAAALIVVSVCIGAVMNSGVLRRNNSSAASSKNAVALRSSTVSEGADMSAYAGEAADGSAEAGTESSLGISLRDMNMAYTDVSINLSGEKYAKYLGAVIGCIEKYGGRLSEDERGTYLLPESNLDALIGALKGNCNTDSIAVTCVDVSKRYDELSSEIEKLEGEKKLRPASSGSYGEKINAKKTEMEALKGKLGFAAIKIKRSGQ